MTLILHYGGAVSGEQYFPRPDLEQRFMNQLAHGAGIKMFGLRRIGKSTLRVYAIGQLEAEKRPVAFIEGQGLQSLSDFLSRLFRALPAEKSFMHRAVGLLSAGPMRIALEAVAKGVNHDETAINAYWQMLAGAIRDALKTGGPAPVLVIDEFTYLLGNIIERQGRDQADRLLASMREWREAGMTMVLTGSIGLTAMVRKHDLTLEHLNDLQDFAIPELSLESARALVHDAVDEPSEGRWTEAHIDEFIKQVNVYYPCFLIRGLIEIGVAHPPPPGDFAAIFAERVRPKLHAEFLNQFNRHFKAYEVLPNEERARLILPVLKKVMEAAAPCAHADIPRAEGFGEVDLSLALDMLTEDGFFHFTEDLDGERYWKPASNLARLWWKRAKLA